MKVKQLIEQLQKFNPESEVAYDRINIESVEIISEVFSFDNFVFLSCFINDNKK